MSDFLEQVVAERRAYAERAKATHSARDQKDNLWTRVARGAVVPRGWMFGGVDGDAFTSTLRHGIRDGIGVIAEVKRISPALGTLAADIDPARQARRYVAAGACAISVLTEPNHWGGSLRDLEAVRDAEDVPILCKDVIVSELQIEEARAAGADAVLLIAEVLDDEALSWLLRQAQELRLQALVELYDRENLPRVLAAGARLIGVNNRDLRTFETRLETTLALVDRVPKDRLLITESGIAKPADVARLSQFGVSAYLVGSAFMAFDDPGKELSRVFFGA